MRKFQTSSLASAAAFALVAGFAVVAITIAAIAIAADKPKAPSKSSPLPSPAVHSHILVETNLADAPGKALTMAKLTLDPGAAMDPHIHTGTVVVYVLSGQVRSKVGETPERVYQAGESWIEAPGAHHTVCENASLTEPAEILATLLSDAAPAAAPDAAPADTLRPRGSR
jgi:quercetin dioxygenase-like cupin family protein